MDISYICKQATKHEIIPALLAVELEITNICNLRCPHCYNSSGRVRRRELTTSDILTLIDDFHIVDLKCVSISGGEPLLHPELRQIITRIRSFGIQYSLNTNGTRLDHAMIKFLKDTECYEVNVSIHSAEKHNYEAFVKSSGTFESMVQSIDLLLRAGLPVRGSISVTRPTIPYVIPTIRWCKDRGLRAVRLTKFLAAGRGAENQADLDFSPDEYRRLLDAARVSFWDCALSLNVPYSFLLDTSTYAPVRCSAGTFLVIDSTGNAFPCAGLRGSDFSVGNVRVQSISDIWLNSQTLKATRRIVANPRDLEGQCGGCEFRVSCGGGCRANALGCGGTILSSDPGCWAHRQGDAYIREQIDL